MPIVPTPTQSENDQFFVAIQTTLRQPVTHKPDGSALQPTGANILDPIPLVVA